MPLSVADGGIRRQFRYSLSGARTSLGSLIHRPNKRDRPASWCGLSR